jgi:DNA-binding response OmpR family regulator
MNATCEIDTPARAATLPGNAQLSSSRNICVWLVDDNHRFRNTLAEFLGRMDGIRCERHFSSPDEMLSTLASQVGPDVILLDVHMRDRNGLDAIASIKALSRETQVLILTSMYDSDGYNRAIAEGASDFLLKSYAPEEIVRRIHNPSRRVTARRRRGPKTFCDRVDGHTAPRAAKRAGSMFKGLKFFRTWLSLNIAAVCDRRKTALTERRYKTKF